MAKAFTYRRLDLTKESQELRFLELQPAKSFSEGVRCTIFHCSLKAPPSYEALSYVWGGRENPLFIHLAYNQETCGLDPSFAVTQNLAAALRHIRHRDTSRIMWIDAICINQIDNEEKAHQVVQMRDVYLSAQRVVLWLGEEGKSSIAIDFLRHMPFQKDAKYGEVDYTWSSDDIPKFEACDELFFKKEYWTRSWIIQEVLHDRDVLVYIGLQTLDIEELFVLFNKYFSLRRAITSISINAPTEEGQSSDDTEVPNLRTDGWFRAAAVLESMPYSLVQMRSRFENDSDFEPRLSELLLKFRDQKAGWDKDKIYSLYGMAKKEYQIEINYNEDEELGKTLTRRELFILVTRQLLARVLVVLLWIESPSREIEPGVAEPKLPSWVPDFTQEQHLSARFRFTSSSRFSADKKFDGGMKIMPVESMEALKRNAIFTIRGIYVGRIARTYVTKLTKKWSDVEEVKNWDDVRLFWYELAPYLRVDEQTVVLNAGPENVPLTSTFENSNWAPCKAEAGDIIVVAAGSKLPLVLRKCSEGFLFVGACFLVDSQIDVTCITPKYEQLEGFSKIMYGSAVEAIGKSSEGNNCEVEEFQLC
jgi:Heterokaryon incompatibility protein (HET)